MLRIFYHRDMDDEPQDEEETTSGGFNHWSGRAQATRRERYNAQTADSSDAEGDMVSSALYR